jgi:hypothetical protein
MSEENCLEYCDYLKENSKFFDENVKFDITKNNAGAKCSATDAGIRMSKSLRASRNIKLIKYYKKREVEQAQREVEQAQREVEQAQREVEQASPSKNKLLMNRIEQNENVWMMHTFYSRNAPRGYVRKMLYLLLEKCIEKGYMNLETVIMLEASGGVYYRKDQNSNFDRRRDPQFELVKLYKSIGFSQVIYNTESSDSLMAGFVENVFTNLIEWWNLHYNEELIDCKNKCKTDVGTELINLTIPAFKFEYENTVVRFSKIYSDDIKEYEETYKIYDHLLPHIEKNDIIYSMAITVSRNNEYIVNKVLQAILQKFISIIKNIENISEKHVILFIMNETYEASVYNKLCEMNNFTLLGYNKRSDSHLYTTTLI